MDKNEVKNITKRVQSLIDLEDGYVASSKKGCCMIGSNSGVVTAWCCLTKKLIEDNITTQEKLREAFELCFKSSEELKKMALDKLINLKEKLDKKIQEKKGE